MALPYVFYENIETYDVPTTIVLEETAEQRHLYEIAVEQIRDSKNLGVDILEYVDTSTANDILGFLETINTSKGWFDLIDTSLLPYFYRFLAVYQLYYFLPHIYDLEKFRLHRVKTVYRRQITKYKRSVQNLLELNVSDNVKRRLDLLLEDMNAIETLVQNMNRSFLDWIANAIDNYRDQLAIGVTFEE